MSFVFSLEIINVNNKVGGKIVVVKMEGANYSKVN